MSGMMGGEGKSGGGMDWMKMMQMMPGQNGGGGGGGATGDSAPNAKMMGGAFEVPDLVAGGVQGMNKGNASMMQGVYGGGNAQPNVGNQGGPDLVNNLATRLSERNPEVSGKEFEINTPQMDNPTGMSKPDFMNPVGKRKDINLGNQSKQLDTINWDNLKL